MPRPGLSHRPQTLRQAKQAYQKSSKTKKLSASELAAIERRDLLLERADRIKQREARRKANLKKKEERIAAEKERAARNGQAVEHSKSWHVGPSQLDLGRFLGGVTKTNIGDVREGLERTEGIEEKEATRVGEPSVTKEICLMPPPPLPRPRGKGPSINDASLNVLSEAPHPQSPWIDSSDIIDDAFVSNTQIERELEPPPQADSQAVNQILAQLCTQDLDFRYEPTQRSPAKSEQSISTQDLILQLSPLVATDDELLADANSSFGSMDDLTDCELRDIAVEVEFGLASSGTSVKT